MGQPRYAQVEQQIRARILAGDWQPGEAIPPETELAQQFGVARMTARQALDGLRREGLLTRTRGRGTFVTSPRVERELSRMHGFSEDMRARGMAPSSRLLAREVVPAPTEVSDRLKVGQREAVIHLRRLRLADAAPMALESSYFNYALCRAILEADLETGSLYSFLQERVGLQILHASQELEAALPNQHEADFLQIARRQPVLAIHQLTYVATEAGDLPAITGRTVYRADRYRFRLEVPR
jgi:GntR family transcriptional regulator, N-acetylglucosamine utilization regulator